MRDEIIESVIKKIMEEIILQQEAVTSVKKVTVMKPKLCILADQLDNNIDKLTFSDIKRKYDIVSIDNILESLEEPKSTQGQIDCLLIPRLSKSNLAKVALGIADNVETKIIQRCLEVSMDIIIWKEGLVSSSFHISTAYSKIFVAYERIIQEFGIKIIRKELFQNKLKSETTKQLCLTTEDVSKIDPNVNYRISKNTIITKLAQEQLQEKNIQLIYE